MVWRFVQSLSRKSLPIPKTTQKATTSRVVLTDPRHLSGSRLPINPSYSKSILGTMVYFGTRVEFYETFDPGAPESTLDRAKASPNRLHSNDKCSVLRPEPDHESHIPCQRSSPIRHPSMVYSAELWRLEDSMIHTAQATLLVCVRETVNVLPGRRGTRTIGLP